MVGKMACNMARFAEFCCVLPRQIACMRRFSTTPCLEGKRNFRKFPLYNKRGTVEFRRQQAINPHPDVPFYTRGVRPVGYMDGRRFHVIPEMVPKIVVPELAGCQLKPYVSYRAPDVTQSEFTARDLFDAVYSEKIANDFKEGKLDQDGNPVDPSPDEKLAPEEAVLQARKTGSDIFSE